MSWTIDVLLPIVTLGALAAVLPWGLRRWMPEGQAGTLLALATTVLVLVLSGAGLFAVMYSEAGAPVTQPDAAGGLVLHFLRLGVWSGLFWGPVLALTGLALAQRVEAERGARMAARTPDQDI